MAFEILNNTIVTPKRLHALVRLVSRLQNPTRDDLLSLLQPQELPKITSTSTAAAVLVAARHCNLVEGPDSEIRLVVKSELLESPQRFQRHMQAVLLGKTNESEDNFLLNLYTAWYAVQGERVLKFDRKQFETGFNDQIFPNVEARQFNDTKLNGWRMWATFLGSGYPLKIGTSEIVIPDASMRLQPLLSEFLHLDQIETFDRFMGGVSERCPDLDGGVLFEHCWQRSRGSEQRGNSLSLMLSTALRVLHDTQQIELLLEADAAVKWPLFPAASHPIKHVSHIRVRSS